MGVAARRAMVLAEAGQLFSAAAVGMLRPRSAVMAEVLRVGQTYTAVIKQAGPWWIGWIEEVPGVNCQERTREELLETLRITLEEALDLNRREARAAAGDGFEEIPIAV